MKLKHPARFYGPLLAGSVLVLFVSFVAVSMPAGEPAAEPGGWLWSEVKAALVSPGCSLPSGTRLPVRLSDSSGPLDQFDARSFQGTLEESLLMAGQVLVPRGSRVTGVWQENPVGGGRAYRSAKLSSLNVGGKEVALSTRASTLQAEGAGKAGGPVHPAAAPTGRVAGTKATREVEVKAGSRLLFVLSSPLKLPTCQDN